jgi:hypothetical protein
LGGQELSSPEEAEKLYRLLLTTLHRNRECQMILKDKLIQIQDAIRLNERYQVRNSCRDKF